MSDIKRSNNPFNGPLAKNQSRTVGSNYGDRSKMAKMGGTNPGSAPTQQKDHFNRAQRAKNLGIFSANASYKSGRKLHSGAPHKPGRLDHTENGMIPKTASIAPRPSDPALLKFLGLVIEKKELHSRKTLQDSARTHRMQGKPVSSAISRNNALASARPTGTSK
jgi:hypothetical protein